jgi:hypothetical protein
LAELLERPERDVLIGAPDSATQKSRSPAAQLRPVHRFLVDGELMAQGEVVEGEMAAAIEE